MPRAIQPDIDLAASLFEALGRTTRRGRGIVRDSYGEGEQAAHDIMRSAAATIGLEVSIDAIGNLYMTLAGRERQAPRILVGSHLDSVPQGGNYDGAAGVVAGLSVMSALRAANVVPECDLSVMAIRAEESAWFDVAYVGSSGAFGLLDPSCLAVRRSDNGQSLEDAMLQRGLDPQPIRERRRLLEPSGIRAFLELHIEQGPTLVAQGLPAAVVTGIRGCQRFRNARCTGAYGHSGAVGRSHRRDAVAATVAFLHHMENVWRQREKFGDDLVLTTGELYTDPAMHGPSKIAGETRFVLDIRGLDDACRLSRGTRFCRAHQLGVPGSHRARFGYPFDPGAAGYTLAVASAGSPRASVRDGKRRRPRRRGVQQGRHSERHDLRSQRAWQSQPRRSHVTG